MPYAIGDPAHIPLGHNALVALIQEQADRFMVAVTLPDEATLGDPGHVDDHNLIVAALQAIADAPAGPTPPTIDEANSTGVSFSTLTNPDGDGKDYRLATMTNNCTLKVDVAGTVQRMLISGGSGGDGTPANHGNGGIILDGEEELPTGTHSVVIGAGGSAAAASAGGTTRIGTSLAWTTGAMHNGGALCSRAGYRPAAITDCYHSAITGTDTYYGISTDSFTTANGGTVPRTNRGDAGGSGGSTAGAGSSGVAYIRWEI